MAEGFFKQNGKFIVIFVIVIWILIGALLLAQNADSTYREENGDKLITDLKLEYGVNDANGDQLLTCKDGTYEVYRPLDSNQLLLCGGVLTDELRTYLDENNK